MSNPYDGRAMDPTYGSSGPGQRPRQRGQPGLPRVATNFSPVPSSPSPSRDYLPPRGGQASRPPRPRIPLGANGNPGESISRPKQVPQWPLAGTLQSPVTPVDSPTSRSNQGPAPRRPPRPSHVPSILDQSRIQGPTPVILAPYGQDYDQNRPSSRDRDSEYLSSMPPTPSSRLTISSVGSIPDFPVPASALTAAQPRRSAALGPPPSSRRGASSFYSTTSYVSPIPEESLKTKSHDSYASSAAIPSQWEPSSPNTGPNSPDAFYEDSITDKSRDEYEEYGDESNLVRRASVGKKGKPSLIVTRSAHMSSGNPRPSPSPVQPFDGVTTYLDASTSSSNTLPMARAKPDTSETFQATRSSLYDDQGMMADSSFMNKSSQSAQPSTGAAANLRRLPRLDIDAVREAEARGSLTSLPDLIRRATRLAAMIEGGKRPASRFDDLFPGGEKAGYPAEKDGSMTDERYRSGLSDMLAAFPPPARASRASWFRSTSWPLGPGTRDPPGNNTNPDNVPDEKQKPKGRRCCGLPRWAFVMIAIVIILIIATAIVIPLQFFVFKTLGNQESPDGSLESCRSQLRCQNGGVNVITQGVCSCICTNGFSGATCTVESNNACTTTDLVTSDDSIEDVTLGRAIPRLIAASEANFSIPLSGTVILSKLNTENLSCIGQNSLVTFNGQSSRGESSLSQAAFITLVPGASLTLTVISSSSTAPASTSTESSAATSSEPASTSSRTETTRSSVPPMATTAPVEGFAVSQQVLDFARVGVLYVLQEEDVDSAVTAQTSLQRFFTNVGRDGLNDDGTLEDASNLNIGGDNTINLVDFSINLGNGPVGRNARKRGLDANTDHNAIYLHKFRRSTSERRGIASS